MSKDENVKPPEDQAPGEPETTPPRNRSPLEVFFGKSFNYANNTVSILGIVVTTVSALSIILFTLLGTTGEIHNPYVGIFAYVILPGVFLLGLVLIPIGMLLRRRKLVREGVSEREQRRYPRLDFNNPQLRRLATVVILLTMVNVVIFGFASVMAVEHMETVEFCGTTCHSLMEPEYTAYQESPHSRVSCTECHIGPGASWFVKSKIDGLYQVYATLRDIYPRPIETPLHNLRPARETCEACHWPEKHYGDKMKVFARFETDEENSASYTAMVFKTGGGSLDLGRAGGIHWWHIYSDNKIRFFGDESREQIDWVELTTPQGEVRVYTRGGDGLPPQTEIEAGARLMDCIDCHNRPTHLMQPPEKGLDSVLEFRPELVALPFYKREALRAIKRDGGYETHTEGIEAVRDAMLAFYQKEYPEIWTERKQVIESGADAAARVYERSIFPEMNTSWETHPNHIGHDDSPGCFRCHDEELSTADGEHTITMDCETCHAFLMMGEPDPPDLASMAGM